MRTEVELELLAGHQESSRERHGRTVPRAVSRGNFLSEGG